MADGEQILIDTSAFFALFCETDRFHESASSVYQDLTDRRQTLWTTSYALVETSALMHRRLGFEVVSEFSGWWQSNLQILWMDERSHTEAWTRFIDNRGQNLSFVDWTIVIASREMDAPVFTFDGGFANQGLRVVPR